MNDKIIPFGKYKGQPLEVLQSDKQYLDWLQTQQWFKEKYQNFNTVIINNFQEPSETPEHNKLQALFLDDKVCERFFEFLISIGISSRAKLLYRWVHVDTGDVLEDKPKPKVSDKPFIPVIGYGLKPKREDYEQKLVMVDVEYEVCHAIFEDAGIDVKIPIHTFTSGATDILLTIEIKPNIGDDYPAILRQMVSNKARYLIADTFSAQGATYDQVKTIFKRSNIHLFLFSEFL